MTHRGRQASHSITVYRDAHPPTIRCSCSWQTSVLGLSEQNISAMTVAHLATHTPHNLVEHE